MVSFGRDLLKLIVDTNRSMCADLTVCPIYVKGNDIANCDLRTCYTTINVGDCAYGHCRIHGSGRDYVILDSKGKPRETDKSEEDDDSQLKIEKD